MTKSNRKILRQAGDIIRDELKNGRSVFIPNLGRFTLGTVTCREAMPWQKGVDDQTFVQTVPRFRAFRALKDLVRKRQYLD